VFRDGRTLGGGRVKIEVAVLGPIEVTARHGPPARVHGLGGRLLLALAVDRRRIVDDDELIDRLWPHGSPTHAVASVRNQVAKLRRAFGPAMIGRDRRGYRLGESADDVRLDLECLEAATAEARCRRDEPLVAAAIADRAIALIRGRPFDEVADEVWAMPAARGALDHVIDIEELWGAMAIAADPASVDIARLRLAAATRPHREVRWLHLVGALAAAGHRTEALRATGAARRALAEFGMRPSDELVAVERQLVGADVDPPAGSRRVPARRDPFVGRDQQLADVLRRGRVAWVEGVQGAGKTRLLAEVADRADPARTAVLYAACPRSLGGGAGLLASVISAVCDLLAPSPGAFDAAGELRTQPDVWPAHIAERIVRLLRTAASEREIVMLVDDVQWLDPAAVGAVVDAVARTADDVQWVIATRPVDAGATSAVLRGDLERAGLLRHVSLGPLGEEDVRELASLLLADLDDGERAVVVADVMAATHGHPLDTAELIGHRQRLAAGGCDAGPGRLAAIAVGAAAGLSRPARHLVELLTVAAGAVPVTVLAACLECRSLEVLQLAHDLAAEGLLAPVAAGVLDLRHDIVRRALEAELAPATTLARRHELVDQLVGDERHVVMLADQLLRGGEMLDPALASHLDEAVSASIDRLLLEVEYTAAGRLAGRYLDATTGRPSGADGLSARLKAATALIAVGDVARGRSTLVRLLDQARVCGDDRVLADAVLAMGPLSTGRREDESVLADAAALVARLPPTDGARRVQLACWVAHHALLAGDRLRATHLLDVAAADPYGIAPTGQGLILAMRAQGDTLVEPGPDAARRSLDELRRFAEAYGDPTADAAERLLAVREAWATGTLADVDAVRQRIASMSVRMPRPDLRWWPLALAAAIELAAGRVEPARAAIDAAARAGRELGVAAAAPTAMAQQLLLKLAEGCLGAAADGLGQLVATGAGGLQVLAGYGLACVDAGDLAAAGDVAARLAGAPHLLAEAGASWPMVAMCASVVASATGEVALASSLWCALERFRGTGLALHSVGYFGSADRCLGLLAIALGDEVQGRALLADALAAERRRGSLLWECLAARDLATNLRS
jgi:DNA-binding SARP family transcriptional activator